MKFSKLSYDDAEEYPEGFEGFKQHFSELYEPTDLQILRMVLPIAQEIQGSTDTENTNNKHVQKFISKAKGFLETNVWQPLGRKFRTNYFESTIKECLDFFNEYAPNIAVRLEQMIEGGRITVNKQQPAISEQSQIGRYDYRIEQLQSKIQKEYQDVSPEHHKEDWFTHDINKWQGEIVEMQNEIKELQKKIKNKPYVSSSYSPENDETNILQKFGREDALTLVHETVHADTNTLGLIVREIPAILMELIAERYFDRNNFVKINRQAKRVEDMKDGANGVISASNLFEDYETNPSGISKEAVQKFFMAHGTADRSEKYNARTNFLITMAINMCGGIHFIGTAFSLALLDKIKSKEDLSTVMETFKNNELNDFQKLESLGLTQSDLTNAVRKHTKNKDREKD